MAGDPLAIEAIDRFIREQMELGHAPGLAITVLSDGEVVLQRGYGYANVETREPMTERSGVVIGSTTKALTCTAIMQLVDQGLVELDAPIRAYIPGFRVADPSASERMTLRH